MTSTINNIFVLIDPYFGSESILKPLNQELGQTRIRHPTFLYIHFFFIYRDLLKIKAKSIKLKSNLCKMCGQGTERRIKQVLLFFKIPKSFSFSYDTAKDRSCSNTDHHQLCTTRYNC